jgi:lipoyl(octanoyl) transferase
MMKNKQVTLQDWGLIDYKQAWDKQEALFADAVNLKIDIRNSQPVVAGVGEDDDTLTPNYLVFCEHPHVYTYHGPGQIVCYPILDLDNFFTDIHLYLRTLEEAVILTLADYGLKAGRYPGYTGVWFDAGNEHARKICALGVRCSRWVTMHGLAFNINPDLDYFNNIVPCGIDDKAVTSMQKELGRLVDINEVKKNLQHHISVLFGMEVI